MSQYITKQSVLNAVQASLAELLPSEYVPNPNTRYKPGGSTGNLAFHAIELTVTPTEIIVKVDKNIAPYMPYTNEPWISPNRNGKKNPNEGWWIRFAEELTNRVSIKLKGYVKQ